MWRLEKKFKFEASHILPYHEGKCRRLHGHSWAGSIVCEGRQLEETGSSSGMLIDYADLGAKIRPLLENYLDHWHLNETTQLENPTTEVLARWIYQKLKPELPLLCAVILEETCTSRCEYRP